jgi:hypothetical protein
MIIGVPPDWLLLALIIFFALNLVALVVMAWQ